MSYTPVTECYHPGKLTKMFIAATAADGLTCADPAGLDNSPHRKRRRNHSVHVVAIQLQENLATLTKQLAATESHTERIELTAAIATLADKLEFYRPAKRRFAVKRKPRGPYKKVKNSILD